VHTFNIEDTAMILIDHQVGTTAWASNAAETDLLQPGVTDSDPHRIAGLKTCGRRNQPQAKGLIDGRPPSVWV
jgi:hypothetical protein